jgi:hypothetical protein
MKKYSNSVSKALGFGHGPDPEHVYVYCTGFGAVKKYFWKDRGGNYFLYSNAAPDSDDYKPVLGVPNIDPNQPMPQTDPEYFTEDGFKRNQAVDDGVITERNPTYDPQNARNIWFEVVHNGEMTRYIYKDSDVREQLYLWVQHQLRLADSSLTSYRHYSYDLFQSDHPKDKVTGAILLLIEQGHFMPEELVNALVSDVEYIEDTVKLLGRKIHCDTVLLDFFTSITGSREPSDPLFIIQTAHGKNPVGINYLHSVLSSIGTNHLWLFAWHANHIYSKIMHRLSAFGLSYKEADAQALMELSSAMSIRDNPEAFIDKKVRATLEANYGAAVEGEEVDEETKKSLSFVDQDSFGIIEVSSAQIERTTDEVQFSIWLHAEPLHDLTPEEEAAIQEAMASLLGDQQDEEDEAGESGATGDADDAAPQEQSGDPNAKPV